jgi:AcrR family transcriptional regulator
MGRKDLSEERTNEILEAFARSMVKYGLDTTLEQVAEEAGMTRSIIRHYIGNREEVVNRLIERIATETIRSLREAEASIAPDSIVEATLEYLFRSKTDYNDDDRLILSIIMTGQNRYLQAKQTLTQLMDTLIEMFTADLFQSYSHAGLERCQEIAYSIMCLSLSHESLQLLNIQSSQSSAALESAKLLVQSLALSHPIE